MTILDYNYNSVSLLLHFDGTNASTTFTDSGPLVKTITANAAAQISTAQSVFGGASGVFGGADWISTPAFTGVDFGAGDFTVEGRVRFSNTASALEMVMSNHASSNANATATFCVYRDATGKLVATGFNGSAAAGLCTSTTTLAAGIWCSFAYVRAGSIFTLFINGTQEATATSTAALNTSVDTFSLGRPGAANATLMTGYIDEFRITKGVARYTANYTPAIEAFPNVVTAGSGVLALNLPPITIAAYGGATANLTLPMPTLAGYGGATAQITLPGFTVFGASGANVALKLPSFTLLATGHDATGENAANLTLPGFTMQAQGGANASMTLPGFNLAAAGTVVGWGAANLQLPGFTLAASGTVSAVGKASLTLPMFTMVGYSGAVLSVNLPGFTIAASGTTGAVGRASLTLPLFQLQASGTMQNRGSAALSIALRMADSGKAWLVMPGFTLRAIGTATVTATYEAYAVNLQHENPASNDEVTRYTNFPFTQVVRYRGHYFGVGANGLYLLEGKTDQAATPTSIPWAWKTGMDDFKSPTKKTVAAAYFRGRLGAAATVTLYPSEADGAVYEYQTPRDATPQNYRQVFGKGVKATHYAIGASGENELALDALELEVKQLHRRI